MQREQSFQRSARPRRQVSDKLPSGWAWPLVMAVAIVALAAAPTRARSAEAGDWVGTWASSPQPIWEADFFAPLTIPRSMWNQTVRQIAHVSIGGSRVRIVLSNEYGSRPLTVGAAHIAVADSGSSIVAGSDRALTFSGRATFTIPPGAPMVSDPIDLAVAPLSNLAVSLFLPEITPLTTCHWEGVQTAYIAAGNQTGENEIKGAETTKARVLLDEIEVNAPPDARAIVTFGDSITDGAASTPDANHRWPDFLAERLQRAGNAHVAVLNEGISGARVLSDRMGVNALARFDRDVLNQAHADTIVLMMGINDIGWPGTILVPKGEAAPSADDVIVGYQQLITRAHTHGMRIIGATLTPFEDTFHGNPLYGYYDEEKEKKRQAVNEWIRSSGAFDGVIDFDAATRDPANPRHILAVYDSGDHLHPQDVGYKAMADSIDLNLLKAAR
jgi:lysophospholipase L1-like esterase